MTWTKGSVAVADDETISGSGEALSLFQSLMANLPALPSPAMGPDDPQNQPDFINPIRLTILRDRAKLANSIAIVAPDCTTSFQPGNVIDVTAPPYNADPTGAVAANTALQDAIDACPVGGAVDLGVGTYRLSAGANPLLHINKAIHLLGADTLGAQLKVDAAVPGTVDVIGIYPIVNAGIQFVCLERFSITVAGGAPARYGIHVDSTNYPASVDPGTSAVVANLAIRDMYVSQLGSAGIYGYSPDTKLDGYFTSEIRDCVVYGGVKLYNVGDSVSIARTKVLGTGCGFDIQQVNVGGLYASSLVIDKCNSTCDGGAAKVHSGSHVEITECNFELNAVYAGALIDIEGDYSRVIFPVIRGCFLGRSGSPGDMVKVQKADNAVIEDNTFLIGVLGTTSVRLTTDSVGANIGINTYVPYAVIVDNGVGTIGVYHVATLDDDWVNFGSPCAAAGYFKDADGVVHLSGTVLNGSAPALPDLIFTLPAGFRPQSEFERIFASLGTAASAEIRVLLDGSVMAYAGAIDNHLCLDGLSFPTEAVPMQTPFINVVKCSTCGNDHQKNVATAAWDAHVSSVIPIVGDGSIEFNVSELVTAKMAGLSTLNNPPNYSFLEYAFDMASDLHVYEGGMDKGSVANPVSAADTFKIERVGTDIKYYVKTGGGAFVLKKTTAGATMSPLFFGSSIYGNTGGFINLKVTS